MAEGHKKFQIKLWGMDRDILTKLHNP